MATTNACRSGSRRLRLRHLGRAQPSLDALFSYRSRTASDLNTIKAARAAIVWQDSDTLDRVSIALRYLLWLTYPVRVLAALLKNGGETRRRFGRSIAGQSADMLRTAINNSLTPKDYYLAALARYGGGPEILNYLPNNLLHAVALRASGHGTLFRSEKLDKLEFENRCRAHGLPVVKTLARATASGIVDRVSDVPAGSLPNQDLMLKPTLGGQGKAIELWQCVGRDCFCNAKRQRLSAGELAERACALAETTGIDMLIQERLENHADLAFLAGTALSTFRIGTIINEDGDPEVVDAYYRTSTGPHAFVDNFHAGGLLFPIEVKTGRMLPGVTHGPYDPSPITNHPQTGASIAGQVHPAWQQASELAVRLHHVFPHLVMPGWDIGSCKTGVLAIEGNRVSGISITRQPPLGGLVGSRTIALLAHHAARWLETNLPESSRWRIDTGER